MSREEREVSLLRFAIGPVQGFVAQSRRTRDLWSSSYLLSYLAGCAMDAAEEAGGVVKVPHIADDRMLAAIRSVRLGRPVEEAPEIGSLPNQFSVASDDPESVAAAATERFRHAWDRICDRVWERLGPAVAEGGTPAAIWRRQTASFWNVLWVYGDAAALARRKSWRGSHRAPEDGDKCTLMTGWQELSGLVRSRQRGKQDAFWASVRRAIGGFDLREDERLCAIALVKRLFPAVARDALGWEMGEGSEVVHWPSTAYLAARPWVERILASGEPALLDRAATHAATVVAAAAPAHRQESGWKKLAPRAPGTNADHPFFRLDGGFYFKNDLELEDRTPLADGATDRESLMETLRGVGVAAERAGLTECPSPFYGVLLVDGDRLGELFATCDDPDQASRELGRFTREVRDLVNGRGGLTVYAGGDDLLAFVPLPSALDVALGVEELYGEILGAVAASRPTASAALVFAHYRAPLRAVILEAHRMLDDDAKEGNGRGSVAVAVWKPSGVTLRWVTTWEHLRGTDELHRVASIRSVLEGGEVSASFLYGQRRVTTRLAGDVPWRPGVVLELPPEVDGEALLRAELARVREAEPEEVATVARGLADLMCPAYRDADGQSRQRPHHVCMDPIFVAHFLAGESPGARSTTASSPVSTTGETKGDAE